MNHKLIRWALFFLLILTSSELLAATINIGSNGCSLANAIRSANSDSAIGGCAAGSGADNLVAPNGRFDIVTSPLPNITSDVTIRSASAGGTYTISGGGVNRVLRITGGSTEVTLRRVQIIEGFSSSLNNGGGIRSENASLILEDSVIRDNRTGNASGSGISINGGSLTILNSLLTTNYGGPGVEAVDADVNIVDTTFLQNAGGLSLINSTLLVDSSLFDEKRYGISAQTTVADVINSTFTSTQRAFSGTTVSLTFSEFSTLNLNHTTIMSWLFVTDSMLGVSNSIVGVCSLTSTGILLNSHNLYKWQGGDPTVNCLGLTNDFPRTLTLADNGGPTQTIALQYLSEAINAGDPSYCEVFDQRGELRQGVCDVGAYEATEFTDIEVDLRIQPSSPYVSNQEIIVFAEITNNGPGLASRIAIDLDSENAFVDFIESAFCPSFPCVTGSLLSGQTLVLPVHMTLSNFTSGSFQLDLSAQSTIDSVHIDFNEDDPDGNNFISYTDFIQPGADLAVEMNLLTSGPFFVGQNLQYEAVVSNLGPQTATGVQLNLNPSNQTISSFTGCSASSGQNCTLANIAINGSRTVIINTQVSDNQFNAVATVSGSLTDIDISNNIDNQNNGGGVSKANLMVQLNLQTPGPYYSYQLLEYTIVVGTGPQAASNIQLFFDFPGAEFIQITGCADFPCIIPSLAANSELNLTARFFAPVRVVGGPNFMRLTVSAYPGQEESDPGDNEDSDTRPLANAADVGTRLTLMSVPPFSVGQEIEYALIVGNNGPNTATAIDVNLLPQNLTLTYAQGELCPTVNCTLSSLNFSDQENITLVYEINTAGAFNLTASAFANEIDSIPANNTDTSGNGGTALQPPDDGFDVIFNDGFE